MANAYFDYLASISKTKINDKGVEYTGIDKKYFDKLMNNKEK